MRRVRRVVAGGRGRLALARLVWVLAAGGGLLAGSGAASAAPGVTTTTTLSASPAPAMAGVPVTLTAAVSATDGTNPVGSVQFEAGSTDIGAPVTVNASGAATTTVSFTAAGPVSLSAVFTSGSGAYLGSTGTFAETVNPADASGTEPITVGVPVSGAFAVTITPGTVNLATSGSTATGTLQDITVTDTRNNYPGWSVSGQDSDFTGAGTAAGSTISGNQLGWQPVAVGALQGGTTLGASVAPVSPGLGSTAATLAVAPPGCGFGTNVLSANLTLDIPATAAAGPYNSTMTVTFVEAGPQNELCVPVGIGF